jgi:hypothetical protein
MDDVSEVVLIKVLDLLPIREVFLLQGVSRSFEYAARIVIASKKQVQIGKHVYRAGQQNCFSLPAGDRISWDSERPDDFRRSVMQMRNLKTLIVCDCELRTGESLVQAQKTTNLLIEQNRLQVLLMLGRFAHPPLHYH